MVLTTELLFYIFAANIGNEIMETDASIRNTRIENIVSMIKMLSESSQKELEYQLQRMIMINKALKLKGTVKDNAITMSDIVKEVNKARDGRK